MLNYSQVKLSDQQNAFAYAAYMMISSCFRGAFCDSRITEEWLHLQYRQEKTEVQDSMAELCAAYADEYLQEKLPGSIYEEKVCVILDRDLTGIRSIRFEGTDFLMSIRTSCQNRSRAVIRCTFEYKGKVTDFAARLHSLGDGMVIFQTLPEKEGKGRHREQRLEREEAEKLQRRLKAQAEAELQNARIHRMLAQAVRDGLIVGPAEGSGGTRKPAVVLLPVESRHPEKERRIPKAG